MRSIRLTLLTAALLLLTARAGLASSFGTLSNFDVVNDTGHECHGFEIELEDVHPADVPYTFGGSYIRYGTPDVLDTTVDPAHPRVVVRYRHWNGAQWEATPVAPAGVSPGGHDCYSGGPIGNYATSGCEHYGVSLSASPTRTSYRWIVATNPSDPNSAFGVVPENVNLPVPVWNVIPQAGGGVDVRAEVEPVEEENHAQYGEPQWLKVFKVESSKDLKPDDLNALLLGLAGGIVPDDTEVETEWKLIQSKPGDAEGDQEDADVKDDPLDAGKRSVIRRYEFYTYNGPRDPENNEAQPCVNDDSPVPGDAPVDGCADLGDFVGAQNVAVDVDFAANDDALPEGSVGIAYAGMPLVFGGLTPYTVQVTGGTVPDGLHVDPVTGLLAGTPTQAGDFTFDVQASDSAGGVASKTFALNVSIDLCPDDPLKTDPGQCGCGAPDDDWDGDGSADCVDLCPFDPLKSDPGLCGCDVPEGSCVDLCPDDPAKIDPGTCGCGVPDVDGDADGVLDCLDLCPLDTLKSDPGVCGCGVVDVDGNANGIVDCLETVRADLGMSVGGPRRTPVAGRPLKIALRVTNAGPSPVSGATISASLTGGPFTGLRLPRACTGTADAISCSTGRVGSGRRPGSKTRTISVIPQSGAQITVDAAVSSPVYDPNPANQASSLTVTVP